jgi:uncharacterized protein YbjT (DUF2867 family)
MPSEQPTYAVAGATGFIGRRLVPALLEDGARVRCLVRDRERAQLVLPPEVELFEADLETDADLSAALDGVELAYFLVHMMGRTGDYAEREREAAIRFGRAATAAGVGRLVYLGGLGLEEGGSAHLDSRHAAAGALEEHGPPLTYFRAAMIVGPGSESYELLRAIVDRLPAVPAPGWMERETQPIGIRDVIAYLRAAPDVPASAGREIQIGGADVLSHLEVIDLLAREAGERPPRRVTMSSRIADPGFVAAGAAMVTTGTPEVASELSHGLIDDTVVSDPSGAELFPVRPDPLSVVFQRCFEEEEELAEAGHG